MTRFILGTLLFVGSGLAARAGELDRDATKPAPAAPPAVAPTPGGGEMDNESPSLAHRYRGFYPAFGGYRSFYRPAWGGFYGGYFPAYTGFYPAYYPAFYNYSYPAYYGGYFPAYYGGFYSGASFSFGFGGW